MFRARERKRISSRLELATNRLTDISSYELPRDSREIHSYVRAYVNVDLLFMLKLTTEMN
ncbi:hypothetical protein ALC53_12601 [Atta colombica]|uniref:Uncharacterized protein n=1 Tax=Atta colombica TaxID=520822 RepID=A0A151HYW5_9HYME|nr:hypothetical protein ALC53_12601 [Atta colombica]